MTDNTALTVGRMLSPGWAAHILVDEAERGDWLRSFAKPFDPWVETGADGLYLRSKRFDELSSARELDPLATDLLKTMSGALSLAGPPYRAKFLSAVEVDADGRRHISVFLQGVTARTYVGTFDGGGVPPAQLVVRGASGNDHLSDALAYFGEDESWFDLYKCMESIESWAGGVSHLAKLALVSEADRKRTRVTANNNRHARAKAHVVPNPPTFDEAREIVRTMLKLAVDTETLKVRK